MEFGEAMGDLIQILEAVESGLDVENYSRVTYQASQEKKTHQEERDQGETREAEMRTRRNPEMPMRPQGQQQELQQEEQEEREAQRRQHSKQFSESPRTRRMNPDSETYGGWDVIDTLTVTQCAVKPLGMQTIEFIPNSLQEEWTEA